MRVLLVEDNPDDAEFLQACIGRSRDRLVEITRVDRISAAKASLSEERFDVVLLARRADLLEETAARIGAEYGVATRCIVADLAQDDIADVVAAQTADLDVGVLVYNAAAELYGPFLTLDHDTRSRRIDEIGVRSVTTAGLTIGQDWTGRDGGLKPAAAGTEVRLRGLSTRRRGFEQTFVPSLVEGRNQRKRNPAPST